MGHFKTEMAILRKVTGCSFKVKVGCLSLNGIPITTVVFPKITQQVEALLLCLDAQTNRAVF